MAPRTTWKQRGAPGCAKRRFVGCRGCFERSSSTIEASASASATKPKWTMASQRRRRRRRRQAKEAKRSISEMVVATSQTPATPSRLRPAAGKRRRKQKDTDEGKGSTDPTMKRTINGSEKDEQKKIPTNVPLSGNRPHPLPSNDPNDEKQTINSATSQRKPLPKHSIRLPKSRNLIIAGTKQNREQDKGKHLTEKSDDVYNEDDEKEESKEGWIGAYSPAERRLRLQRFWDKKKRRIRWDFQLRHVYWCRRSIAHRRLCLRGRFLSSPQEEALRELMGLT